MPLPVDLVVKKGSNARPSVSSSMPVPLSLTETAIIAAAARRSAWPRAVRMVERAALGHGVARVDRDVEQRRFELGAVGLDRAQASSASSVRTSIRSPSVRSSRSVMPRIRSLTSITSGWSGWRRAKASSWPVSAAARPAAWTIASAKRIRFVLGDAGPAQHVGRALDDGQQIVEIVGDAAGELAERLHLLRLAQLLLGLGALARPGP